MLSAKLDDFPGNFMRSFLIQCIHTILNDTNNRFSIKLKVINISSYSYSYFLPRQRTNFLTFSYNSWTHVRVSLSSSCKKFPGFILFLLIYMMLNLQHSLFTVIQVKSNYYCMICIFHEIIKYQEIMK